MKLMFSRIHVCIAIGTIMLTHVYSDMAQDASKKNELKNILEVKIIALDNPSEVIVPDSILPGSVRNQDPFTLPNSSTYYYILVTLSDDAKKDKDIAERAIKAINEHIQH